MEHVILSRRARRCENPLQMAKRHQQDTVAWEVLFGDSHTGYEFYLIVS